MLLSLVVAPLRHSGHFPYLKKWILGEGTLLPFGVNVAVREVKYFKSPLLIRTNVAFIDRGQAKGDYLAGTVGIFQML